MDYNHAPNYHCHQSATAASPSKSNKLLDGGGGDPVAVTTTKGPKLKALPTTTAALNGRGGGDPEAAVGHHHHLARESLENVMPSNNSHSAHNLSNNSQRYFTSQVLCSENGTKWAHHVPKAKGLRTNGEEALPEEQDNNHLRMAEDCSSANVQTRRVRGRSESTEPATPADGYFNGRNVKAGGGGGGEGGGAAALMNGTACSSMFKADSDVS